ncbi:hypothetical protein GS454_04605 [Rhodococcus hoagii]|nr:hypothetical protein [Prescottella equi]
MDHGRPVRTMYVGLGSENPDDDYCDSCGYSYNELDLYEYENGTIEIHTTLGCTGGWSFEGDRAEAVAKIRELARNYPMKDKRRNQLHGLARRLDA